MGKISKWAAASGPFCCSMLRMDITRICPSFLKRIKRRRNAFEILCQVFFLLFLLILRHFASAGHV